MPFTAWRDYSDLQGRPGWGHVITVSNSSGFYIMAFLSTIVTIAGGSAWAMISLLIHAHLARKGTSSDVFGLQQQVALRNPGSAFRAAWDAFTIHWSWSKVPATRRLRRTAMIAVPGIIVWAFFTVASIMVSKIATDADSPVMVRVKPHKCGFMAFTADSQGTGAGLDTVALEELRADKFTNDTIDARAYALSMRPDMFRNGEPKSSFIKPKLGYTLETNVPCLFPNETYCLVTDRGAVTTISLTSDKLNSHLDLGINAPRQDRVFMQQKATCSLVDPSSVASDDEEYISYDLGAIGNATDDAYTFVYPKGVWNNTVGYQVHASYSMLGYPDDYPMWRPAKGFARDDADLGIVFLNSNGVRYSSEVQDPWFRATRHSVQNQNWASDWWTTIMVCADQYRWCSSAASGDDGCTPYGGIVALSEAAMSKNGVLGFNHAQRATAARLASSPSPSVVDSPVVMGPGALFASRKVLYTLQSSGLSSTQWHTEVTGWFETALADQQASADEFVRKGSNLEPFKVFSPFEDDTVAYLGANFTKEMVAALKDQCYNQLAADGGQLQNFSMGGVIIVIVVSSVLILIGAWFAEILDLCSDMRSRLRRHRGKVSATSQTKIARQADDRLHLLRYAIDGAQDSKNGSSNTWRETRIVGVPVLTSATGRDEDLNWRAFTVDRPVRMNEETGLFEYPKQQPDTEMEIMVESERQTMLDKVDIEYRGSGWGAMEH